jgi:hypothetical protein
VYDRFHVVLLVNGAVDEVRREGVRSAEGEQKRSLKSTRWALLKNPWNLTRGERQKLSELQRNNRQIYPEYLLKESFQQITGLPGPPPRRTYDLRPATSYVPFLSLTTFSSPSLVRCAVI